MAGPAHPPVTDPKPSRPGDRGFGKPPRPASVPGPRPGSPAYAALHPVETLVKSKGGHVPKVGGLQQGPVDVKGIQRWLRSQGYDIAADGQIGPQTKAALADFLQPSNGHPLGARMAALLRGTAITGSRNPHAFNQRYGANKSVVVRPNTQVLDKAGNAKYPTGGGGGRPGTRPGPPNLGGLDLAGLSAIANSLGVAMPESSADQLAGLEYDSAIHDSRRDLAHLPIQGAQNLHDIGHWYDQVLGAEGTAAQRDKEISQAGVGSVQDAVSRIVSSLGGAANDGSAMVGAAGADNVGMLGALGSAQDQYNQDIQPLLRAESAGASTREQARQSQVLSEAKSKLTDLLTSRGQSKAKALMDIRQYNNGLAQQGFQNTLALKQAEEAALLSGAKMKSLGKGKPPRPISPAALSTAAGDAVSAFTHQDENGADVTSTAGMDPRVVVRKVKDAYRAAGMNVKNQQVAASAMAVLRRLGITPDPHWFR